jgi:hypothetical protein
MDDNQTFKFFYTKGEAIELSVLLYKNGVPKRIQKSSPSFYNQLITGNSLPKEFHVQISEDDFIKANNILDSLERRTD